MVEFDWKAAAARVREGEAAMIEEGAAELAALRERVAEAERQLRAIVFDTHTSHDLARAKEDAIKWLTPSGGTSHG